MMDEYQEWLIHPQTKEFKKYLEALILKMQAEKSLSMDNPYWTHAQTAMKEGKIEAIQMIINDLKVGKDEAD